MRDGKFYKATNLTKPCSVYKNKSSNKLKDFFIFLLPSQNKSTLKKCDFRILLINCAYSTLAKVHHCTLTTLIVERKMIFLRDDTRRCLGHKKSSLCVILFRAVGRSKNPERGGGGGDFYHLRIFKGE